MKERLILALDTCCESEALDLVRELKTEVGAFKIGLQLFLSTGRRFVEKLSREVRIFLDLKFHDIPNTVAKAAIEVSKLGVWMFNVHALGGFEMMRRTVEEVERFCQNQKIKRPKILGVTILTSANQEELQEVGMKDEISSQVIKLSKLAFKAGLDGVVASAQEASQLRSLLGKDFKVVSPGIRSFADNSHDQKRIMTPKDAIRAGVDYLVIGRPIIEAKNRVETVKEILKEMEEV